MVLRLDDLAGADQPSLAYIGKAINEFKSSGKQVYAIGNSYNRRNTTSPVTLKVHLTPQGVVGVYGFATNGLYYKSLLEKLKVSSHIFQKLVPINQRLSH